MTDTEFSGLMDRLGGFERRATVAVAVSGGADSMALAILASRWARRRRGRIVALTVDHGLRTGSRAEAKEAHRRLSARGIDCKLLVWRGAKPTAGIQAAARDARYRLIARWCRRHGVLHVLVAHHREDQAETVLQRLARASGVDGLAGMAAIHELRDIRLLRPCLSIPRDRLRAVLTTQGVDWAEDPSNEDRKYERVRMRALLRAMALEGVNTEALAGTAHRMESARATLEARTARFLSTYASLYPEGYALLDRAAFSTADSEVAQRVLSALLTTIAGSLYPPRHARLTALCTDLRRQNGHSTPRSRARTLGGCRVIHAGANFLICREAGRCEVLTAPEGSRILWDNRFCVRLPAGRTRGAGPFTVRSPGEAGLAAIRDEIAPGKTDFLPKSVRMALPAICRNGEIVAVPHLRSNNVGIFRHEDVQFMPPKSVTSARFSVV